MSTMTITSRDQYGSVRTLTVEVPVGDDVSPAGRTVDRIICPISIGSERQSDIFQLLFERALREGVLPGKCPADATITAFTVKPPA